MIISYIIMVLSYHEDYEMNADEKVEYAARSGEKSV
jgi:hypothetical protein